MQWAGELAPLVSLLYPSVAHQPSPFLAHQLDVQEIGKEQLHHVVRRLRGIYARVAAFFEHEWEVADVVEVRV